MPHMFLYGFAYYWPLLGSPARLPHGRGRPSRLRCQARSLTQPSTACPGGLSLAQSKSEPVCARPGGRPVTWQLLMVIAIYAVVAGRAIIRCLQSGDSDGFLWSRALHTPSCLSALVSAAWEITRRTLFWIPLPVIGVRPSRCSVLFVVGRNTADLGSLVRAPTLVHGDDTSNGPADRDPLAGRRATLVLLGLRPARRVQGIDLSAIGDAAALGA